ncbi:MAG: hypothetical protein STHCBS139747_006203 [Sporothrix thermara]
MADVCARAIQHLVDTSPAGTLHPPESICAQEEPRSASATEENGRTATATEFPYFSQLPIELQMTIWETAALPPACKHYLFNHTKHVLCNDKTLPAQALLPDRALWRTCVQSRRAMFRVYKKAVAYVDEHGCLDSEHPMEQYYLNLARVNVVGRKMESLIYRLPLWLRWYFNGPQQVSFSVVQLLFKLDVSDTGVIEVQDLHQ